MHLIIGFLAVLLVFSLIRYGINSNPKQRRKMAYKVAIGLAAAVLLLLLLTGRIHVLAALAAAVIPFAKKLPMLLRYIPLYRSLKQTLGSAKSKGAKPVSVVETSLLIMSLNHITGAIDGEVRHGLYEGARLTQLTSEQLFELYKVSSDQYPDALPVFNAFLQHHIGHNWREGAAQMGYHFEEINAPQNNAEMDVAQALQVLGLEEGATKEDVLAAHRKLMQKLHPDRGGSNFLAAQVNQAKDLLLKNMGAN